MIHINTKNAPTSDFYNQGILIKTYDKNLELLFLSGQTGNNPEVKGEPVIEGGVGPQTKQALQNLCAIVKQAYGFDYAKPAHYLVALDVFLKDPGTPEKRTVQRILFNAAYLKFFEDNGVPCQKLPVRSMIWVCEVPLESPLENTVVEIKGIAAIPIKQVKFF